MNICANCGKDFSAWYNNQKYCCEKCKIEAAEALKENKIENQSQS